MDNLIKKQQNSICKYLRNNSGPGINNINEITPSIFISDYENSKDIGLLREYNIKHVINLSDCDKLETFLNKMRKVKIKEHRIFIRDEPGQSLTAAMNDTYDIIQEIIDSKKKVLIHCNAGVSRAPSILISYFMRRQYMISYEKYIRITKVKTKHQRFLELINPDNSILLKIIKWIKTARPCINPNPGFIYQLIVLEHELKRQYADPINKIIKYDEHLRLEKDLTLSFSESSEETTTNRNYKLHSLSDLSNLMLN